MNTFNPDLAVRLVMHEVRGRLLYVSAIRELSPRMRRFTFSGEDLEPEFPFLPMATADHVKLVFPDPETGELRMPEVRPDGIRADPTKPRPVFRDYTVRAVDRTPAGNALTIDFVVHGHGVAGNWAGTARLGDVLGVLGPRGSHVYPEACAEYLIGGDETALPAIARWLEELPAAAKAAVFISVLDVDDEIPLARPVTWLHRSKGASLQNSVRDWATSGATPATDCFVWLAGESTMLQPIRRFLRREVGLAKIQLDVDGYWKQGAPGADHHQAEDSDDVDE